MFEKLWTKISGYCLFGEGGPGKKNGPRFTKGSNILKNMFFSEKVGLYSGGLGGQNSTLVRSLEYSVG